MRRNLLLNGFTVDPSRGGARIERLACLSHGPVQVRLHSPLTFLIGENGSGKTTLLEAVAARCAIRPGGGRSCAETGDDRESTAISGAVDVMFGGMRPKGLFLRADRFAETMALAGSIPMAATGEWRPAHEQSRGEGVLSLLTARVDASEDMLFLLDGLHKDGRSQAIVATHSAILMAHPAADLLWVDDTGVERRALDDIPHWRDMRRFMREPKGSISRLLD